MRKVELKKFGVGSVFKATIYIMIIPLAFIALIGLIVALVGAIVGETTMVIFGVMYLFMPVFMIFLYAGISALSSLIYNMFAKKFGGLEVYIDEEQPRYNVVDKPLNTVQSYNQQEVYNEEDNKKEDTNIK